VLAHSGSDMAPARARAIGRYASALFTEIHHHHQNEDQLVWPVIAGTAGQAIDLTPLTDDHEALLAVLDRATQALTVFGATLGERTTELYAHTQELRDLLDEHIQDEEAQIFPIMRRYVPAEANAWCLRQVQRQATLARLKFVAPWLARFARPDELQRLLAFGGWPVRLLLAAARPGYRRLERRALGAVTESSESMTSREGPADVHA
jgi:Hemerythrin HHE cation binding domain